MPESVSGVDAILDGLREKAVFVSVTASRPMEVQFSPVDGPGGGFVEFADAVAAVHAAADAHQSAQHAVLLDQIRELHQENERLRAASPDERLREALHEIVRQVKEYPARSPTGIMVRDDIAGMVDGTACLALAAADREAPDDWRCECGDLNRGAEAFCFRCGACPHDDEPKETT